MIVDDRGFRETDGETGIALPPDASADDIATVLRHAPDLVCIGFPSFADGRGFTLARSLRAGGFRGRLRATGHLIADQYAMARRSGFDEVEIDGDLAGRQGEAQWRARADWRAHDYQGRLGRTPARGDG